MNLRLEGALVRAGVEQTVQDHATVRGCVFDSLALPRLPVLPATGGSRPLSETRLAAYSDGEA